MPNPKPILCLDFDGVLHSYTSGWQGADKIPDPPVENSLIKLAEYTHHFHVHIYSSRSHQSGGIPAMKEWLQFYLWHHFRDRDEVNRIFANTEFPNHKPPALVTIDDRTWPPWDGTFPPVEALLNFKPWHKK